MPRKRKAEAEALGVSREVNASDHPERSVATFRPPSPRTDEWAALPNQTALREIDLAAFEAMVESMLRSEGLPTGIVSDFEAGLAVCKVHLGCVRVVLQIPEGGRVQVTHCGCDSWLNPIVAPPEDTPGMVRALTDEILWYWRSRADIAAMVTIVAEACESEAAKARCLGLDSRFIGARAANFDTFRGRRQHANAFLDLIHDSLSLERWSLPFWSAADVTKFFRSVRPYHKYLADRMDELAAAGATGAIDRLALAGIAQLGLDPLHIIADLAKDVSRRQFDLGGSTLLLHWHCKTIKGTLLMPAGTWQLGNLQEVGNAANHHLSTGIVAIGKILSSELLSAGTRLKFEKLKFEMRNSDWVEAIEPECDLFAFDDGMAKWVLSLQTQ